MILGGFCQEKTKPICSYCVSRDVYCGKEKDKNKPESRVHSWLI